MSKIGRTTDGGALGADVGRRQRQAAGPADDDLVGRNLDRDVVGVRTDRDAVDRFQQRQLDEILPLDEAANRRRRRDHQEVSPASGSTSRCSRPGLDQRHGDIGMRRIDDVAHRHQRLGRRAHGIGEGQLPAHAVGILLAVSDGICGRLRRIRIACPFSSGSRVTSAMIDPPLARIGSTSIGLVESNTSHSASARRNNAAGVGVAKVNVRFRPSLSRVAPTATGFGRRSAARRGTGFGAASSAAGVGRHPATGARALRRFRRRGHGLGAGRRGGAPPFSALRHRPTFSALQAPPPSSALPPQRVFGGSGAGGIVGGAKD